MSRISTGGYSRSLRGSLTEVPVTIATLPSSAVMLPVARFAECARSTSLVNVSDWHHLTFLQISLMICSRLRVLGDHEPDFFDVRGLSSASNRCKHTSAISGRTHGVLLLRSSMQTLSRTPIGNRHIMAVIFRYSRGTTASSGPALCQLATNCARPFSLLRRRKRRCWSRRAT